MISYILHSKTDQGISVAWLSRIFLITLGLLQKIKTNLSTNSCKYLFLVI